jgi:DNA (cytosine-5)-methyltransferase 1
MLKILDLFSGIGGFSLGLEQTNEFQTIAFCEIDLFCQQILNKHWPDVTIFSDIKEITSIELEHFGKIDVICGGFPCQPVSVCGHQRGNCDERWLWPEFYRVICMVRPRWILVENVVGLLSIQSGKLFSGILRDLAQIGYDAEWQVLRASDFGACHKRERLFLVAYSSSVRLHKTFFQKEIFDESDKQEIMANVDPIYLPIFKHSYPNVSSIIREDYGISCKLDKTLNMKDMHNRIKSLGNAIVPQCTQYIGRCIINQEMNQNI